MLIIHKVYNYNSDHNFINHIKIKIIIHGDLKNLDNLYNIIKNIYINYVLLDFKINNENILKELNDIHKIINNFDIDKFKLYSDLDYEITDKITEDDIKFLKKLLDNIENIIILIYQNLFNINQLYKSYIKEKEKEKLKSNTNNIRVKISLNSSDDKKLFIDNFLKYTNSYISENYLFSI